MCKNIVKYYYGYHEILTNKLNKLANLWGASSRTARESFVSLSLFLCKCGQSEWSRKQRECGRTFLVTRGHRAIALPTAECLIEKSVAHNVHGQFNWSTHFNVSLQLGSPFKVCVCVCVCLYICVETAQCCAIYDAHTIQDIYDFSVSFLVSMPFLVSILWLTTHSTTLPFEFGCDDECRTLQQPEIDEYDESGGNRAWSVWININILGIGVFIRGGYCISVATHLPSIDLNVIQFIWMLYIIAYLAGKIARKYSWQWLQRYKPKWSEQAREYHKFYGVSNNKKILMVDPNNDVVCHPHTHSTQNDSSSYITMGEWLNKSEWFRQIIRLRKYRVKQTAK